jgi:hypothetical protein
VREGAILDELRNDEVIWECDFERMGFSQR